MRRITIYLAVLILGAAPLVAAPDLPVTDDPEPVGAIMDDPDPAGIAAKFYAAHPWSGAVAVHVTQRDGETIYIVEPRQFMPWGTCDPSKPEDCTKRVAEECKEEFKSGGTVKPGTVKVSEESCEGECEMSNGSIKTVYIVCAKPGPVRP